ncbi:MAG: ABC transporter permease subunit [Patescibacteria group bacterium]|nr:ABC transporter permease subunit [Patescibacteria group bacterium]
MKTIFLRVIKDRYLSLIIFLAANFGFAWMYIGLFPYIQSQAEELQKLIETYPQGFLEVFGGNVQLSFSHVENYLAMEMFSFIWPILIISLVVGMGAFSVAGEIEKGTMETILAQPISRAKIFFAKYLAGFFNLFVFTTISVLSIILLILVYGINFQLAHFLAIWLVGILFSGAIFSLASFLSAVFSDRGKVIFFTVGLVVLMYAFNILSSLKKSVEDLKFLSFFHYFNPNLILGDGKIEWLTLVVFLGAIILFFLLGLIIFKRRDISVS